MEELTEVFQQYGAKNLNPGHILSFMGRTNQLVRFK